MYFNPSSMVAFHSEHLHSGKLMQTYKGCTSYQTLAEGIAVELNLT